VDGEKLAKLLYLDEVPAVHVPGVDVRAWRGLINYRRKLVARRAAVKTQVRALLRGLGIAVGVTGGLWTKRGVAWLTELALASAADRVRRDVLADDLAHLEAKVATAEKELDRIAKGHPGVALLRTIPGVGPRTAEAFVAHVDDVSRASRGSSRSAVTSAWSPARMRRRIAIAWVTSPRTARRARGGWRPRRRGRVGVAARGSARTSTGCSAATRGARRSRWSRRRIT
jgi:transposase